MVDEGQSCSVSRIWDSVPPHRRRVALRERRGTQTHSVAVADFLLDRPRLAATQNAHDLYVLFHVHRPQRQSSKRLDIW